jgi:hypothetical protein
MTSDSKSIRFRLNADHADFGSVAQKVYEIVADAHAADGVSGYNVGDPHLVHVMDASYRSADVVLWVPSKRGAEVVRRIFEAEALLNIAVATPHFELQADHLAAKAFERASATRLHGPEEPFVPTFGR